MKSTDGLHEQRGDRLILSRYGYKQGKRDCHCHHDPLKRHMATLAAYVRYHTPLFHIFRPAYALLHNHIRQNHGRIVIAA